MYRLHYLDNSRAHRILWMFEELGVEYDVEIYPRDRNMRAPESLTRLHPLGKSPIVEAPDGILAESGAIMEELVLRHPEAGLAPADPLSPEGRRYRYWMHAAEGSVMPLLVNRLVFSMMPRQVPALIRPVARMISKGMMQQMTDPGLKAQVAYWQDTLADGGYFAGDHFTAADIQMSFPVEAAVLRLPVSPVPPAITAWLEAIRARPAYARALERGGAYDYAE
ncbi:glutathione S-transferase family protein [Rhodalgimonas zhirmunskyi]|uniref:Glutathione S-transferase n=1 Tax=Rhodalgimonas zhirmunskyi TaxID=2964767 RepID=A0AAJ1U8Z9_9RHOB|nr:glutathione S-transferase [Rhodoalgimonas zhirmunskyi]MDQ2094985.1 glutathione S-transferase [Rhodoalgimonas zhirmunskyi]